MGIYFLRIQIFSSYPKFAFLAHYQTNECDLFINDSIEDAIQNGVKHTEYGDWLDGDERFDNIIENGIKENPS